MIRNKRSTTQVDLFKEDILSEDPSYLKADEKPPAKVEFARTMNTPVLQGQFNGTASEDQSTTKDAVKEILLKPHDAAIQHESVEESRTLPVAEDSEKEKTSTTTIRTKVKSKIINRDFSDGFYLTEAERKKQQMDKADARRDRKKYRLRLKLATVGILSFFSLVLWNWQEWVVDSPLFVVRNIYVQGATISRKDEIIEAAAIEDGRRLADVNLSGTADRIKKNPLFQSVAVSRQYPSAIVIRVEERKPFCFVATDDLYSTDAEGFVLPKFKARMIYNLPIISGVHGAAIPGKKLKSEKLDAALNFLRVVKQQDDALYYDISEITIAKDKMIVFLSSIHVGFVIDHKNIDRTALYLGSAADYFHQRELPKEVNQVDLRYDGQIFVRK